MKTQWQSLPLDFPNTEPTCGFPWALPHPKAHRFASLAPRLAPRALEAASFSVAGSAIFAQGVVTNRQIVSEEAGRFRGGCYGDVLGSKCIFVCYGDVMGSKSIFW